MVAIVTFAVTIIRIGLPLLRAVVSFHVEIVMGERLSMYTAGAACEMFIYMTQMWEL